MPDSNVFMLEKLSLENCRDILEALPTAVYVVDRHRRIILWNSGAEKLTGYLRHEVIGRSCMDDLLMHCDENHACLCGVACPLQQTMFDGEARVAEVFLLHKDGSRVPVTVRAVPLRDQDGTIGGAVECFERRHIFPIPDPILCQLGRDASLDTLTGLPDRAATMVSLRAYLERYAASPIPFGVLVIALDSPDQLVFQHCHTAVSGMLHTTSQTLAGAVGPNDMIGRWSATRFLAVVTSCSRPELARAATMLQGLVASQGMRWWGDRLQVTVSIGGTVVEPGDTMETLVSRAQAALDGGLHGQVLVV